MNITDSDILSAARELRDEQNANLHVAPNPLKRRPAPTPLWWAATAAALAVGFFAGMNLPGSLTPASSLVEGNAEQLVASRNESPSLGEGIGEAQPAIIREIIHEVVHDTIYETRIVRVPVQQVMTAQAEPAPPPAPSASSGGCSMLCDDIRYDLLAGN
ncbi:MAG: hypothetical protein IJ209_07535 [Bacteroidaceae bacterium]|nr:hypothetical protein [Bacteroidaceae bacterium]